MKIITNLKELNCQFKRPVIAIGIFDGLHRGHKMLIRRLIKKARTINGTSIVVTFDPHPASVLRLIGSPPLLVSLRHRLYLLSKEGVDVVCVLRFNRRLAGMTAEEFVQRILIKRINPVYIFIGKNFKFGSLQKGNIQMLRQMGKEFDFKVCKVPLLKLKGKIVSSTSIRKLIMAGRLKDASFLLGREVSILGTVVRGRKRGRILGYPTANIDPQHEAIPPSGVYAVYVRHSNKLYKGLLNIGFRPTFKDSPLEPAIEVHILDFHKKIYGKEVEIIFVKKLRKELRFQSKKELIAQIKIDESNARMVL